MTWNPYNAASAPFYGTLFPSSFPRCGSELSLAANLLLQSSIRGFTMDAAHIPVKSDLSSCFGSAAVVNDAHRFPRGSGTHAGRKFSVWDSVLLDYIFSGKSRRALALYQKMRQRHLYPGLKSYMGLLKCCIHLKDSEMGCRIHSDITEQNLIHVDAFIGGSLVDMYAKLGLIAKAQELHRNLPVRDVVSWTTLIAGYVKYGSVEESLDCFKKMQDEGIPPNSVTFLCILKACRISGAICKGAEIHSEVVKKGLEEEYCLATTLVDMYAKSGLFQMAQQVFQKIPVPGIVPWTAMIAGYCKHKNGQEALNIFKDMQLQGVLPDADTYVCCIKACGCIKAIDKGREVHALVANNGSEKVNILGNVLINMYMNFGLLQEAEKVFDNLHVQNVVSWTALIKGLVEHDFNEEALDCFEQMKCANVRPDIVTFLCCLKACGNIGYTDVGQHINAEVARTGILAWDIVIGNALVDMYASCGLLKRAAEVFKKLPFRDQVSWTTLITAHVEQGQSGKALGLYAIMRSSGIYPDVVTYCSVLKACGNLLEIEKGMEIHAEIYREGFSENDDIQCSLVDLYAKCGLFDEALQVIIKVPFPNLVLWNAMVYSCMKSNSHSEVLSFFIRMKTFKLFPDMATYILSLRACGCLKLGVRGQEMHAEIVKRGMLHINASVGNALIDMYSKCGLFEEAVELLERMPADDFESWSALVEGYAKHGWCEESLKCFQTLQLMQLSPNATTVICILKACIATSAVQTGQDVHSDIARRGLDKENIIGNTLIDMYANFALFTKAHEVFDGLLVRDVVSWTALVAGYVKHGFGEEALTCFDQMIDEDIAPDSTSFVCCLHACSIIGALNKGFAIHSMISDRKELEECSIIGNILLDMYSSCGMVNRAQEVFDKLVIRDSISWTSLITGYAHVGEIENVFYFFEKMMREGREPSVITYIAILNACSHAGLSLGGCRFFELMLKDYSVIPNPELYNCMLDGLGRAGQLDSVQIMIETIPYHPDSATWNTVLAACRKWGDTELGRKVFEHVKDFGEEQTAAYVCISNIYAEAHI